MSYFLFLLLVFLTPFVVNPFFGYFFEPPKVIFVEILIEILLLLLLLKNGFSGFFRSLNKNQLILSAILIILTIIHLKLSLSSHIFFGNEFRLQGIFLLWHLLVLSFLSSRLNIAEFPRILFPISLLFLLLGSILIGPDMNGRAVGTLGEANALAASAIFFFPFAFGIKGRKSILVLRILVLLATISIILLSGSRSALVAFFIQIVFLIFNKWIGIKKAAFIAILAIFLSLMLPMIPKGGWYENRAEIWRTAFFAGWQNIFGNGFGNIEQSLNQASVKINNNIKYQAVDSSHNFLLDYWVQGGAIGLGVIISLIFLSLKKLIRNNKTYEIAMLLGLICVMLFNPVSVATLVAFWFVLGQGFKDP